jgi:hypothetical protein
MSKRSNQHQKQQGLTQNGKFKMQKPPQKPKTWANFHAKSTALGNVVPVPHLMSHQIFLAMQSLGGSPHRSRRGLSHFSD